MRKYGSLATLSILVLGVVAIQATQNESPGFSRWVDGDGGIRLPQQFRETWAHLGSWAVADAQGKLSFHEVYTEPASVTQFNQKGEFPDWATLVKEIRGSQGAFLLAKPIGSISRDTRRYSPKRLRPQHRMPCQTPAMCL